MPWNDQAGGSGEKGGSPGSGGRGPWGGGTPPRGPGRGQPEPGPDLEEMLRRWRNDFARMFGKGGGGSGGAGGGERRGPRGLQPGVIAAVAFFGWLATGIYIVDEGERGVVSRFGAALDHVALPGLHWHLPLPIETVRVISVSGQRSIDIGVGEGEAAANESLMITGDRNVVDIDFRVIYRLSDARKYLFNVAGQADAVRGLAESSMREVVGQRELQAIITTDRAVVESAVADQLQEALNSYDAGIEVLQVQLLKAAPPAPVVDAFNEVVRAGQVAETAINVATQYANEVVPRARGQAAQIIQAAEAYREQTVREATGDAARFSLVEQQYRAAPQVTRQRLYLEAMERIYGGANTIIIERGAGAVPILPLDQLRRPPAPSAPAAPAAAPQAQSNR